MADLEDKAKIDKIFSLQNPSSDFIPYACHYDNNTILTKNGELMQTIKIVGVSKEIVGETISLRDIVRKSLLDNIKSQDFAVWVHTVRRKANLDSMPVFPFQFATDTHERWCQKNFWRDKYINELFITIIIDGNKFISQENKSVASLFSLAKYSEYQLKELEKNSQKLNNLVDNMLNTLQEYGAKRLSVEVDQNGAKSSLLSFINKIIYLRERSVEMPISDLSYNFVLGQMAFGDKSFQIIDEENNKSFGAILSIKDYQDFSENQIEKLLGVPQEFIISQTLTFVSSKIAIKDFEYSNYILNVSRDEWLREKSGLKNIMESDKGNETDFGLSQLSMMVIGDNPDQLEAKINMTVKEFKNLGMVIVREDINMELAFWSHLPGNFNFLKRTRYLNTARLGGFASLHNSPKGRLSNIWGNAVSIFRLSNSMPYFFNFHNAKVGHTLVCGPKNSGKSTLVNFLLSESSKYNPNIFIINQSPYTELLVRAFNGSYDVIDASMEQCRYRFNPLSLPDTQENRNFLGNWFKIIFSQNLQENQEIDKEIARIIERIYSISKEHRQLKYAEEFIQSEELLLSLKEFRNGGIFANLFDNEIDNFSKINKIQEFNIANLAGIDERVISSLILYLIHRFTFSLNASSPSIFVVNDSNLLFKAEIFKTILSQFLDEMTAKNAIAIMLKNTEEESFAGMSSITPGKFSGLIMMPDDKPSESYKNLLKLSDEEIEIVKKLRKINRHFLVKQQDHCLVAELNIDALIYALPILVGNVEYKSLAYECINKYGSDPNDWLDYFYIKIEDHLESRKLKL